MSLAAKIPGLQRHGSKPIAREFDRVDAGRSVDALTAEFNTCPAGFVDWLMEAGTHEYNQLLQGFRRICAAELARDLPLFKRECATLQSAFRQELVHFASRETGVQHGLF
ncbi:MAG: hypothetical protein L3J63_04175 [Geopsychrobacter sp.]|nr:hypothetical protein [Geopsychrobacter sp.]